MPRWNEWHVGTNGIAETIYTYRIFKKLSIKSKRSLPILESTFIPTDIPNIGGKVQALNSKLKTSRGDNLVTYIENANIDETCLGKRKLHPNKKGKAFLQKNIDLIGTLK